MNTVNATIIELGEIKFTKAGTPYMKAVTHCYGNNQVVHIVRKTKEELESLKMGDEIYI